MADRHSAVQVTATGWQGSRGDVRLLARLGLSQAGLQDERDAQEKALAAKNRWRRKSSTKGQFMCRFELLRYGSWSSDILDYGVLPSYVLGRPVLLNLSQQTGTGLCILFSLTAVRLSLLAQVATVTM